MSVPVWKLQTARIAVILAMALAGCGQPPQPSLALDGSSEGVTDPFTLPDGYYSIQRQVTSAMPGSCYYFSRLETMDGHPSVVVGGPLVGGFQTATYETDGHWIPGDRYVLHTFSGCGEWRVNIARQVLFDEESKAKVEGRSPAIFPAFGDPQYLRDMPPPVATAPASAVAGVQLTPQPTPSSIAAVVNTSPVGFVNVRSAPSTLSSRLGSLPEGSLVALVGFPQAGWVEVEGRDFRGYVATQYLSGSLNGETGSQLASLGPIILPAPTLQPTVVIGVYRVVNTAPLDRLNVRSAPNLSAARSGTIPDGSFVTLVRRVDATWVQVTGQDFQGYVQTQYLSGPIGTQALQLASLQPLSPAPSPIAGH